MSQITSPDALLPELVNYVSSLPQPLVLVAIERGGLYVLNAIKKDIGVSSPYTLNINFYRDDFVHSGLHPNVGHSNLPPSIDDCFVMLIDDVIHTGRTVRSAMNELFDYGRPSRVGLCVLYDRGQRELPIQPDWAGQNLVLPKDKNIQVHQEQGHLGARLV